MIFKRIDIIKTASEKALFEELVSIYCKIVREICNKYDLPYSHVTNAIEKKRIAVELVNMGIIEDDQQLNHLSSFLKNKYAFFIDSVLTYLDNTSRFGNLLDKLNNSKRNDVLVKELSSDKPTVADFFAGAGGLSLGFIQSGFRVCFANDFEEVCINTYRYNHPEVRQECILKEDIRLIVDNVEDYIKGIVDVVIGGPPCQGFSSANQQRIIDDPRNELYKYFLRAVERIAPKFVVMENVRGMLKVADQVVEDYQNIRVRISGKEYSYHIKYELLNSVNFGVAQSRERLIYIAIREDIASSKHITPDKIFEEIRLSCHGKKYFTLAEALSFIKPLDAPRIKNTNEIDDEKTGKKIDKNLFTGHDNDYLTLINQGRDIPLVFNHKARYLSDVNYDIYRLLNPGDDASDKKISDIMPYKHRLHCFKDKYYKLIPDRPSRTITAHLKMDCHSHIHPYQIRAITPREAARCQSFPDDYLFLGAYLKTYMEIGNAVPVLMSRQIAKIIKEYI